MNKKAILLRFVGISILILMLVIIILIYLTEKQEVEEFAHCDKEIHCYKYLECLIHRDYVKVDCDRDYDFKAEECKNW